MSEPSLNDNPPDPTAPGAPDDPELVETLRTRGAGHLVFGRYRLVRELGAGGMAVVWLANDERLGMEVALKFLPGMVASDPEALHDLRREITRGLRLTHPGIVRVYDLAEDSREGLAAITMEYVDGRTLAEAKGRQPGRCFEVAEPLLAWTRALCEVLSYVHEEARVIHRDIKPRNLMITSSGRLKVADFGIAATLNDSHSRLTQPPGSSGTPVYMSPQQALGRNPGPADDIYAWGATWYELLTSKPPFFRGNMAVILHQVGSEIPPSMAQRREELGIADRASIPPEWEKTIAACLAKEPAERPKSMREVSERLFGSWRGEGPISSSQPSEPDLSTELPTIKVPAVGTFPAGPEASAVSLPEEDSLATPTEPQLKSLGLAPAELLPESQVTVPLMAVPADHPATARRRRWPSARWALLLLIVLGVSWIIWRKLGSEPGFPVPSQRPIDSAATLLVDQHAGLQAKLDAAALLEAQGRYDEAESGYRALAEGAGTWVPARNCLAALLVRRGEAIEPAAGNRKLKEAVEICRGTLLGIVREAAPKDWAQAQGNLGNALRTQGERAPWAESQGLLAEAVAAYQAILEMRRRAESPPDWAAAQDGLGRALLARASRANEPVPLALDAEKAFQAALEVRTRAAWPRDWAITQEGLGRALQRQLDGVRAVAANRAALEVLARAQEPQSWASAQVSLAITLTDQAHLASTAAKETNLNEAINACQSALTVRTQAAWPQAWAATQHALGEALATRGNGLRGAERLQQLGDAIKAYRAALEVRTPADLPPEWVATQTSLAQALWYRAAGESEADAQPTLREVVKALQAAFTIWTQAERPEKWADMQTRLGDAHYILAKNSSGEASQQGLREAMLAFRAAAEVYAKADDRIFADSALGKAAEALSLQAQRASGAEGQRLLAEAVAAYRSRLTTVSRASDPLAWWSMQNQLGSLLFNLGKRASGEESRRLLVEAVACDRAALEVYSREQLKGNWKVLQGNLAGALEALSQQTAGADAAKLSAEAEAIRRELDSPTPAGQR